MTVVFRSETMESTLLDPRLNFDPVTVKLELRFDPLTGRSSRLAHLGAIQPQPLNTAEYDSEKNGFCPFCPPNLEQATSLFPKDFIPEGRVHRGEATLIANIAPYDAYSGLVVLSPRHVLLVEDLTKTRIYDAIDLGIDFLKRVKRYDGGISYYFMGWNYMPPAGGGLVHAHIQTIGGIHPGNYYMDLLHGTKSYQLKTGGSFWQDYFEQEQESGCRYLAKTKDIHWLVPFAPLGAMGDTLAVIPGASLPEDITHETLDTLTGGICALFNYYRDKQIYSFNASFLFGPEGYPGFPVQVRFSPRTFLNTKQFPPDTNFFHVLLQQPICVVRPEDLCREIKPYFSLLNGE